MWYPIDDVNLPEDPHDDPNASNVELNLDSPPDITTKPLSSLVESEKDLDISHTLALGFAPFSLDEKGDHRTIILDYMRYVDVHPIRWGVGMRFVLHAWSDSGTVKGSVALVAAQASLNMVYTRATFQVIGYKGQDLELPGFEEMSVTSYPDLLKAIDACDATIGKCAPNDVALLDPKPIAVSLTSPKPDDIRPHRGPFHLFHRHQQ